MLRTGRQALALPWALSLSLQRLQRRAHRSWGQIAGLMRLDGPLQNEHAASLEALYYPAAIDRETFLANVRFQPADMRNVSTLAGSNFDFSLELLFFRAALDAGFRFVLDEMSLRLAQA